MNNDECEGFLFLYVMALILSLVNLFSGDYRDMFLGSLGIIFLIAGSPFALISAMIVVIGD